MIFEKRASFLGNATYDNEQMIKMQTWKHCAETAESNESLAGWIKFVQNYTYIVTTYNNCIIYVAHSSHTNCDTNVVF